MDPALWEMLEGDGSDEVEAIIRLRRLGQVPAGVRLVATFGETIATCRLQRGSILDTRSDEACASLKAPRLLIPDTSVGLSEADKRLTRLRNDTRRPEVPEVTGRGVVLGVVDWGADFAHPNFRHADGTTRLLALWDQRRPRHTETNRYGYGTVYEAAEINQALASDNPYSTLGYHPADGDPDGKGAHGTHVMDIAAGNGRAGAPIGVAPAADLVFVHLATRGTGGLANLGDSVTLLEAVDFILETAGDLPCCMTFSLGCHGGPHDGTTGVELALDALLETTPNLFISQSTGNYFRSRVHASGQVPQSTTQSFAWYTDAADRTPNELEVWYSGSDVFKFGLQPPDSEQEFQFPLGDRGPIEIDGQTVGRIYHRSSDPNNADNHIDVFLDPDAPAGSWRITLEGLQVLDGGYHAWVERDAACRHCQSRFARGDADSSCTTGTICNGRLPLVVGAYDAHSKRREPGKFSSSGPTRDGRPKPDLLAPGVEILAARSASREALSGATMQTRKSGTSMATPHVAGTMALIAQIVPDSLTMNEMRGLILNSTKRATVAEEDLPRVGAGYLNIENAIRAARELAVPTSSLSESKENHVEREEPVIPEQNSEEVASGNRDMITPLPGRPSRSMAINQAHNIPRDQIMNNAPEYNETEELLSDSSIKNAEDEESPETFEYKDSKESGDETYLEPKTPEAIIVEWTDHCAVTHTTSRSSGEFLNQLLQNKKFGESLQTLISESFPSAATLYTAFIGKVPALQRNFERFFEVAARPGDSLGRQLKAGDILIRHSLESDLAHVAVLATGELYRQDELEMAGLCPETRRNGFFAQVVENVPVSHSLQDSFARRLAREDGRLTRGHLVLRLHPYLIEALYENSWKENKPTDLRTGLSLTDAENIESEEDGSEFTDSPEDILTFPELGQSQLSAVISPLPSNTPGFGNIDIRSSRYSEVPDKEFIYLDCGQWGSFGNHHYRHFGLIYGTAGSPGFAAICHYTGSATSPIHISGLGAETQSLLNGFLRRTHSDLLRRPGGERTITLLNGINTQGHLIVLLGDLHLPVWRPGQPLPQDILIDGEQTVGSQIIPGLSRTALPLPPSLSTVIDLLRDRALTLNRQQWQAIYPSADIFGNAAHDLYNFLNLLEQPGNPLIYFVQAGDMFELWVGLPKHFSHNGSDLTLPSDKISTVSAWISSCKNSTRINGESLVDKLHNLSVAHKLWIYGNHDNYLKFGEITQRARLDRRYMNGRPIWDRGMSVWVEHGHSFDAFNNDRNCDQGWQITQAAFLAPRARHAQSVLYENVWDRDRNKALEEAVKKSIRLSSGTGRAMKVYAMAHTHKPFLSHVKVYRAAQLGAAGYIPTIQRS